MSSRNNFCVKIPPCTQNSPEFTPAQDGYHHLYSLRVAAYCRVSTDSDEQATSYEAQIEHYTDYIKSHPEWTLAGIFADDGISGTNTKKREEFNRMIAECDAGNIDMIITNPSADSPEAHWIA